MANSLATPRKSCCRGTRAGRETDRQTDGYAGKHSRRIGRLEESAKKTRGFAPRLHLAYVFFLGGDYESVARTYVLEEDLDLRVDEATQDRVVGDAGVCHETVMKRSRGLGLGLGLG